MTLCLSCFYSMFMFLIVCKGDEGDNILSYEHTFKRMI